MVDFETAKTVFATIGIGLYTLVPAFHPYVRNKEVEILYRNVKMSVWGVPSGWFFSIVWTILYFLMAGSIIVYWVFAPASQPAFFIAILSTYIVNVMLNHLWPKLFFTWGYWGLALFVQVLILLTAAGVLTLYIIVAVQTETLIWISAGLYMPYVLWLIYAMYLGIAFVIRADHKKERMEVREKGKGKVEGYAFIF